jgi:hypothetical protein
LTGYALVEAFYEHVFTLRPTPSDPASHVRILLLACCMFLTGAGGSAGLSSSVNATAKSFPDQTRASATGTVLAGFGLSAFLFSTVGHIMYKGDAGGLLFLLSIGTGLPMIVGSFIIRPVPPSSKVAEYDPVPSGPGIIIEVDPRSSIESYHPSHSRSNSLELIRSRSPFSSARHRLSSEAASVPTFQPTHVRHSSCASSIPPSAISYSPLDLLRIPDFYILFVILALLCGTGLMYINNAGTVALALARQGQFEYDKTMVSAWQAQQVATVSVWNCAGRILGGEF